MSCLSSESRFVGSHGSNQQESPTKDLVEHGLPLASEARSSRRKCVDRLNASDDSSDGNVSEESECRFFFSLILNHLFVETDLDLLSVFCQVQGSSGRMTSPSFLCRRPL